MAQIGWRIVFLIPIVVWSTTARAFEFNGFGDVTYTDPTREAPENTNGRFALGQMDLYFAQPISDRLEVLTELVIETRDGESGIDLERLQIGYLFNDALKVRAGRFHNLLGYWNMAYHHGTQIQTTIERPRFLNFEDNKGILPVHAVGLWVSGRQRIDPLILHYGVMLSNGSRIRAGKLDPNNVADNNPNKQVSLDLRIVPAALSSLAIGFSGNFSEVQGSDAFGVPIEVNQQIYSADLEYIDHRLEFLSEYYAMRDRDHLGTAGVKTSEAYYGQLGWTLIDRITPYTRYERTSIREADPYFRALGTTGEQRILIGIRCNLAMNSSLKAEIHWTNPEAGARYRAYKAQWAFAF